MTEAAENTEFWENVWRRFQDGDKESFALIYNRYVDCLFDYGCCISKDGDLVKDAIQEIFIDLYQTRLKNRSGITYLKYYLYLSLKRNLIRKLSRNRRFEYNEVSDKMMFEPDYNPESNLIDQEIRAAQALGISEALNQLPPKQKEAVYLRFNEGLEYSEIAEIMGIATESVRKQVYRAVIQIKKIIDAKGLIVLFYFFRKKS